MYTGRVLGCASREETGDDWRAILKKYVAIVGEDRRAARYLPPCSANLENFQRLWNVMILSATMDYLFFSDSKFRHELLAFLMALETGGRFVSPFPEFGIVCEHHRPSPGNAISPY